MLGPLIYLCVLALALSKAILSQKRRGYLRALVLVTSHRLSASNLLAQR